ncbi:29307_t:CDS:1, partial [Racocetra persica]
TNTTITQTGSNTTNIDLNTTTREASHSTTPTDITPNIQTR